MSMASHLASIWNRGSEQLRNGLQITHLTTEEKNNNDWLMQLEFLKTVIKIYY